MKPMWENDFPQKVSLVTCPFKMSIGAATVGSGRDGERNIKIIEIGNKETLELYALFQIGVNSYVALDFAHPVKSELLLTHMKLLMLSLYVIFNEGITVFMFPKSFPPVF